MPRSSESVNEAGHHCHHNLVLVGVACLVACRSQCGVRKS